MRLVAYDFKEVWRICKTCVNAHAFPPYLPLDFNIFRIRTRIRIRAYGFLDLLSRYKSIFYQCLSVTNVQRNLLICILVDYI